MRLLVMKRWVIFLTAALLAWSWATADALAEGRWQQVENKANCAVWNDDPQPNDTVTWTGGCSGGKANGKGAMVLDYLEDGTRKEDTYTGMVKDGKAHRRGIWVDLEGNRYEGNYRNGNIHGYGVMTLANGRIIDGNWRDNRLHGRVKAWLEDDKYCEVEFFDGKITDSYGGTMPNCPALVGRCCSR